MQTDNQANSAGADERYLQELSALLDGECNQSDSILEHAASDDECRAKWQSYHLIRDVMQKECHSSLPADFCSLVSEKIALEEDIADASADVIPFADASEHARRARNAGETSGRRRRRTKQPGSASPRWLPVAGFGLAASVAAAGFIGWQVINNFDQPGAAQSITVAQGETTAPQNPIAGPINEQGPESGLVRAVYRGDTGTRWVAVAGEHNPRVEQRLNSLLLNHLEDSSMTRVQGMAVHSRLVGYDAETIDESF